MRRVIRWAARLGAGLSLLILAVWLLFPPQGVDTRSADVASPLPDDLDAWLADSEARFPGILPGTARRIVWAGEAGKRTPLAVVYLHGFSASLHEIRPVPDEVARLLGANLYFVRLTGHGQDGEALAAATAEDWLADTAQAMAIARRLGDRVVVIGTSTGATLASFAAVDPEMSKGLAGVVMISPNFGLRPFAAHLLDLPLAPVWGPWVAGAERSFVPVNADHARYWTLRYPTAALFPMAALVRQARTLDLAAATMPLLLIHAAADQVTDPARLQAVADGWGGTVSREEREMTAGDDPYAHVIAGDILSPGQTEAVIARIVDWAQGL